MGDAGGVLPRLSIDVVRTGRATGKVAAAGGDGGRKLRTICWGQEYWNLEAVLQGSTGPGEIVRIRLRGGTLGDRIVLDDFYRKDSSENQISVAITEQACTRTTISRIRYTTTDLTDDTD